jgi:hypothetical protein
MAAKYWMNTTGAVFILSIGWRIMVDNMRAPAGETHMLDPRPRPATWTVAVAVKPVGNLRSNCVFLLCSLVRARALGVCYTYFSNNVLVLVTTSPYSM